ncbi:hypothetical protein [Kineococcus sp. SYSU DK002]|uniref:hypothetical protein n=1 Tax=Kineococcus sp. SYSU DK002 TaxID=3383123 RepID=UPI003D7E4B2F
MVRDHQRRAEELAGLRYRGRFGEAIPVVDREVSPAPPALTPRFGDEDGLTRVSWAAAPEPEEIADEEGFSASRSVSDWFSHRWDDVTAAVDAGTDRVSRAAVDLWQGAGDALGAGRDAVVTAWDGATGASGEWVDENLAGMREWIGDHVGVFRWLAKALRVVGWVVVAVGAVLTVALGVIGALGGATAGAVFGFGVGAVPAGPAGALAGVTAGLGVVGAGFSLVSAGDFLDGLADWGEGEIDGQELVQRGAAELALAVTSLIGIGAVVKGGKELLGHLPPSWAAGAEEFLGRLFSRDRAERDEPGTPDVPGNALPLDPNRPWTFDIARDEARFPRAHTTDRHGADIPLRREDAGPGGKSIEGRIHGDEPWARRENTSSRWLSDEVMNSTIDGHVRQHWGDRRPAVHGPGLQEHLRRRAPRR